MKCLSHYYIELEKNTEINFIYEKCSVDTLSQIPGFEEDKKSEFGYLRLSFEYELKEYEAIIDGALFSRPRYLSILGILSFLLDQPFDVFGSSASSTVFPDGIEGLYISKEPKLLHEGIEYTEQLKEILNALSKAKDHEKSLIFSLLDRWRKGRFLEEDTSESLLYDDETTLSYFHVLELLGDVYSKTLIAKSKALIESFVSGFNDQVLSLHDKALENENVVKSKLLANILEKDISVSAKILHFFKSVSLYSKETDFWIKNLVQARNNVAHGRRVHYDKAIFPVKPFFPLNENNLYPLDYLRILTAKAISNHLEISVYDEKWEEVEDSLIPDPDSVKSYLETGEFSLIDSLKNDEEKIVFGGLNFYILIRKIKPQLSIQFYSKFLELFGTNEDFLASNIDALVILYEEMKDESILKMLEDALIKIVELDCNPHLKFRDLRYFLDFHNYDSPKLESLIIDKKIK